VGNINATTGLMLNGADINTAGTLSNVAYENQANTFTQNQTINYTGANYGLSVSSGVLLATSGGNVGIGTTSPTHMLHINNNTAPASLRLTSSTDTKYSAIAAINSSGNADLTIYTFGTAYDGGSGSGYFGTGTYNDKTVIISNNATDFEIGAFNNVPIIFGNNNTERMRIAAGGNIGIGTTSPGAKLDIVGTDCLRVRTATATQGYISFFSTNTATIDRRGYIGTCRWK
jgi:hypothetical protein